MLSNNDAYGDGNRKVSGDPGRRWAARSSPTRCIPLEATDFSAQLAKVKAAEPRLHARHQTFSPQTRGLVVMEQARALGLDAQLAGPLATNDIVQQGGAAAEGFSEQRDRGRRGHEANAGGAATSTATACEKYGVVPDWSSGTIYESVYLLRDLIEAVAKEGGDPRSGEALLEALQRRPGGFRTTWPRARLVRATASR